MRRQTTLERAAPLLVLVVAFGLWAAAAAAVEAQQAVLAVLALAVSAGVWRLLG